MISAKCDNSYSFIMSYNNQRTHLYPLPIYGGFNKCVVSIITPMHLRSDIFMQSNFWCDASTF